MVPISQAKARRWPLLLVAVAAILGFAAFPASAQEGTVVQGTLTFNDAEGEKVPVEGVTLTLSDAGAAEVASTASAADGTFSLEAPSAGDYVVTLDETTLPEGVTLRNPDRAANPISLSDGQSKSVLFPLDSADGAAVSSGGSNISKLPTLLKDGLIFGLIIAMCSIGLSLILGTTGLTNFAHGELVTLGAVLALTFNINVGLPVVLAAVVAVVLSGVAGGANELGLWRPLRKRGTGLIAMLVISIGLSILVRYLILYFIGGRRQTMDQYTLQLDGWDLLGTRVVPRELWIIGISILVLVLVALAVQRTRTGKAMRAVSDNRDLAESSGIDVDQVILTVWVSGGALAGLGGFLFGLNQGVSWSMGFELLLLMFAAVTLGGLGTAYGPLLGSLVVGIFINLSTLFVSSEIKNVGALAILGIILLVRPQGLLGRKERIG